MRPKDVWLAAQGQLEVYLHKNTYNTWLKSCHFISFEDGVFTIGTQNDYVRDYLANRLYRAIRHALSSITNQEVDVRFIIVDTAALAAKGLAADGTPLPKRDDIPDLFSIIGPTPLRPEALQEPAEDKTITISNTYLSGWESHLNPTYAFGAFVVGSSNQMAYAAADAVSQSPGQTSYNPLFIHGDVGLGKTHLLHAIGNRCAANGKKVLYITAEEFTNQLIESIREKRTTEFRDLYRHVDVLLVDDIQFVVGKDSTQEEFYHTFNALHDTQKQIVIAADRRPSDIKGMNKRLASRMEWGLVVDVQMPTYETRLAIVQEKAAVRGHHLPDGVAEYLAERRITSVRELEGLLNQVTARASLLNTPMSLAVVEQMLEGGSLQRDISAIQRRLTVSQVIERAAAVMQMDINELLSESRSREITSARQWVVYIARQETAASWPEIGLAMGGRNHSTVLRSYNQLVKKIETDPAMRRKADEMRRKVIQFSR